MPLTEIFDNTTLEEKNQIYKFNKGWGIMLKDLYFSKKMIKCKM